MTNRGALGLGVVLALGLIASRARAEEGEPSTEPPPAQAAYPRGRGGIGGLVGGSTFYNGSIHTNVDVFGLYVRFGLQFSPSFGTEFELAGGTSLLTSSVHGAFFFDLQPNEWVAFAVGPVLGLNTAVNESIDDCPYNGAATTCHPDTGNVTRYLGGAARVDFFPWHDAPPGRGQRAVDLGFEAQLGRASDVPIGEATVGFAAYFFVGQAFY